MKYLIVWLSFVIFKTTKSNEIISIVKKLEKIKLKIIKMACHLKFNETCINNSLLPTYTNIKLHDEAARQEPFVLQFRKDLIIREINDQKKSIDSLSTEYHESRQLLRDKVTSNIHYLAYLHYIKRITTKEEEKLKEIQNRKLVNLYGGTILLKQTRDSVINISKCHLDKEVIEIMSLGMKCHMKTKFSRTKKKIELEKLYADIKLQEKNNKVRIENHEYLKSKLKSFGLKNNKDYNNDLLTKDQHNTLRELKKDERIIIRKADKSNVFVVMERQDYCDKISNLIADPNKFEKIDKNPILSIKRTLNSIIDSVNAVSGGIKLTKLIGHYEPAYIYGNPKIHKSMSNPPLRPIISQIGTPSYEIAKQINSIIIKYLPKKYMIESTFEFLSMLKGNSPDGVLASLDVESLFTNVPVTETINIIIENVYKNEHLRPPSIPEKTMKEILSICTTKSPFRGIDGDLYLQTDGVMMGSPLGCTFANFYMCHIENKIAEEHQTDMPLIYARYVDDIFILCRSPDEVTRLKTLFEHHSVLKFTFEHEQENKLVFLDTIVTRNNEMITTAVHTKTTSSDDCINYISICPDRYKTGVIKTLFHRAHSISSTWQLFHEEAMKIKQRLTNNNFPMSLIDKTLNEFLDKVHNVNGEETKKEEINLFYQSQMCSNYKLEERQLREIIEKNVEATDERKKVKLNIFYKNKKLSNLLISNRFHKLTEEYNVVYRYECNLEECNSLSYIGYTESTLVERMRNHGQHGSIIRHLREVHGIPKMKTVDLVKNTVVIGRANTRRELLLMEALLIKDLKPELNSQEEGRDRVLFLF